MQELEQINDTELPRFEEWEPGPRPATAGLVVDGIDVADKFCTYKIACHEHLKSNSLFLEEAIPEVL